MREITIFEHKDIDEIIKEVSMTIYKIKEDTIFNINTTRYLAIIIKRRPKIVKLYRVIDENDNIVNVSVFARAEITREKIKKGGAKCTK